MSNESILRMAAFTAIAIAKADSIEDAQSWLSGVLENPGKWSREAEAFQVLVDANGYSHAAAGAAINAAMGVQVGEQR